MTYTLKTLSTLPIPPDNLVTLPLDPDETINDIISYGYSFEDSINIFNDIYIEFIENLLLSINEYLLSI